MADKSLGAKNEVYQISLDTPITEIIEKSTHAVEYLAEYGLHCFMCPLNVFDTVEMGAKIHGMSDEEIKDMIEDVNERLGQLAS